ncbi:MAG: type II secretion system GspH family protein [Saccharofermentans sp.]|nr:type II secretion system GspH family protein [Saccharofermentans sp.]
MKKTRKYSKKGFTLVELIVVLVILAVMAAMLVPALTGYIDEARKKKDYNAAAEVLTAAQAVVTQYYGANDPCTVAGAKAAVTPAAIQKFTGDLNGLAVQNITFADESDSDGDGFDFTITGIEVSFDDGDTYYEWDGSTWS